MAVTIRDVAARAGVSPSTVSRTCKDHPSISRETKERVRQAMAELGYEYNSSAGTTSLPETKNIGIILPPSRKEVYENPFYLEAIRGISQFCNTHQYYSTVITGEDDGNTMSIIRSAVQNNKIDGFILLYSRENDPIVEALFNEGLVYVMIGKAQTNTNQTIYVDNDNVLAGQDATEYLLKLGHRKIAFFGSEYTLGYSADRKTGYQMALLRAGLTPEPAMCLEALKEPEDNTDQIRQLLSEADRPTGIVVSDDILALTLARCCSDLGVSIPEDLSVVSFNNSIFARLVSPQLTSVDVNSFQLGIEAASQLINHLENPNLLATKIIVPHFLTERNSCKAL